MDYKNDFKECGMMVWEIDPKLRNTNNVIKFNLKDNLELKINDVISHHLGNNRFSNYRITEIIELKKSSLSGYNYYTAKTEHYFS